MLVNLPFPIVAGILTPPYLPVAGLSRGQEPNTSSVGKSKSFSTASRWYGNPMTAARNNAGGAGIGSGRLCCRYGLQPPIDLDQHHTPVQVANRDRVKFFRLDPRYAADLLLHELLYCGAGDDGLYENRAGYLMPEESARLVLYRLPALGFHDLHTEWGVHRRQGLSPRGAPPMREK